MPKPSFPLILIKRYFLFYAWILYGIIRSNSRSFIKCYFAIPLDVRFAFEAELAAIIHAIEYAWSFN